MHLDRAHSKAICVNGECFPIGRVRVVRCTGNVRRHKTLVCHFWSLLLLLFDIFGLKTNKCWLFDRHSCLWALNQRMKINETMLATHIQSSQFVLVGTSITNEIRWPKRRGNRKMCSIWTKSECDTHIQPAIERNLVWRHEHACSPEHCQSPSHALNVNASQSLVCGWKKQQLVYVSILYQMASSAGTCIQLTIRHTYTHSLSIPYWW